MQQLFEQIAQQLLSLVHAGRQRLKREHGAKLVHRQPRQPVGVAEDQAAALGLPQPAAVFNGPAQAALEKGPVNVLTAPGEQPQQRLGRAAHQAAPDKISGGVQQVGRLSRHKLAPDVLHLRGVDGVLPPHQPALLAGAQHKLRHSTVSLSQ